jgi:hypothetical protein
MAVKASVSIGGRSDDNARHEADFYPTPRECTLALMKFLDLPKGQIIWEPACGDGAISKVLEELGYGVYSTDIRKTPDIYGYGGVDFINDNIGLSDPVPSMIITNPPFNLSADFIRACQNWGMPFALLLKSQYWHASGRRALFNETKPSFVLPLTWRPNFAPDRGKSPTMDMVWTVWLKDDQPCRYQPLERPTQ